jgi:hypothetical protein
MEGKIIIGIITAFILVITASYINSENLSKTQKIILFILIIFPPAQWIVGLIFLSLNKNGSNQIKSKTEILSNVVEKNLKNDIYNDGKEFDEKQTLLKKSLNLNLITEIEFKSKMMGLKKEKDKIEKERKNSRILIDRKNVLEKLYEKKIISKEEFDIKLEKLNKEFDLFEEKNKFPEVEILLELKKRIIEYPEQNNKDLTFIRGLIMTLSLKKNCNELLLNFKSKYNFDLLNEIELLKLNKKDLKYILEPLVQKKIITKIE